MIKYSFLIIFIASTALADRFHIIDDATMAISSRIALVKSAKRSIYSSKFIFKNDKIGLSTLALIRAKARKMKAQGITPDIRLIFDSLGSFELPTAGSPIDVLMHLEDEGIEIKFYNDIFNGPKLLAELFKGNTSFIFGRMHDKLLIVDNNKVISGGRNIQDSYYGVSDKNYLDRDVYVSGKAAYQARNHFLDMWDNRALTKARFGYGSLAECLSYFYKNYNKKSAFETLSECQKELKVKGSEKLDKLMSEFEKNLNRYDVDVLAATNVLNQSRHDKKVEFIADTLDENGKYVSKLSDSLIDLAKKAKESLVIETPYLIPDENMFKLFKYLLNNGVKITLVTNALSATDGLAAFAGYSLYRKKLVNIGPKNNKMKIYEYTGSHLGKYLHAKSASIDNKYALIGSYNLDPRSDKHNTEVMFVAHDKESVLELRDSILSHTRYSWPIGPNGNPYGGDKAYPKASNTKILKVKALRRLFKLPIIGKQLIEQL